MRENCNYGWEYGKEWGVTFVWAKDEAYSFIVNLIDGILMMACLSERSYLSLLHLGHNQNDRL